MIKELIQFNPSMISGNQKWKGAAPIFIIRDKVMSDEGSLLIHSLLGFSNHRRIKAYKNTDDAIV